MADKPTRVTHQKPLVVYYSLTGNTARVARDLAARLGAELESIRDRKHGKGTFGFLRASFDALRASTVDIAPVFRDSADYPLLIVGTPIWAGRMTPAVRAYLQKYRGKFHRLSLFATSENTLIGRVLPTLEAASGTVAEATQTFDSACLKGDARYREALSTFLGAIERRTVAAPNCDGEAKVA